MDNSGVDCNSQKHSRLEVFQTVGPPPPVGALLVLWRGGASFCDGYIYFQRNMGAVCTSLG
jgi:hypothetical protein